MEELNERLEKWHKQANRLNCLTEEYNTLKEKLDSIGKEILAIQKNKYKYTDILICKHRYWANSDFSTIIKVGSNNNCIGIEFFVSEKGKKDQKFYSSSLGILYHGDIPITEEQYEELYKAM